MKFSQNVGNGRGSRWFEFGGIKSTPDQRYTLSWYSFIKTYSYISIWCTKSSVENSKLSNLSLVLSHISYNVVCLIFLPPVPENCLKIPSFWKYYLGMITAFLYEIGTLNCYLTTELTPYKICYTHQLFEYSFQHWTGHMLELYIYADLRHVENYGRKQ